MNRDHTDHVEDVKDEQCFAELGMDAPNDEGIVFVASAEVAPTTCQICICLTLIHSLVAARPEEDKVRDEIFPDQKHKVVRK